MAEIIQFPVPVPNFSVEKLAKEVMEFCVKKEIEAMKENSKKEEKKT